MATNQQKASKMAADRKVTISVEQDQIWLYSDTTGQVFESSEHHSENITVDPDMKLDDVSLREVRTWPAAWKSAMELMEGLTDPR